MYIKWMYNFSGLLTEVALFTNIQNNMHLTVCDLHNYVWDYTNYVWDYTNYVWDYTTMQALS